MRGFYLIAYEEPEEWGILLSCLEKFQAADHFGIMYSILETTPNLYMQALPHLCQKSDSFAVWSMVANTCFESLKSQIRHEYMPLKD
jgi:hypothetical protein